MVFLASRAQECSYELGWSGSMSLVLNGCAALTCLQRHYRRPLLNTLVPPLYDAKLDLQDTSLIPSHELETCILESYAQGEALTVLVRFTKLHRIADNSPCNQLLVLLYKSLFISCLWLGLFKFNRSFSTNSHSFFAELCYHALSVRSPGFCPPRPPFDPICVCYSRRI